MTEAEVLSVIEWMLRRKIVGETFTATESGESWSTIMRRCMRRRGGCRTSMSLGGGSIWRHYADNLGPAHASSCLPLVESLPQRISSIGVKENLHLGGHVI
jgi:hypothetical protein